MPFWESGAWFRHREPQDLGCLPLLEPVGKVPWGGPGLRASLSIQTKRLRENAYYRVVLDIISGTTVYLWLCGLLSRAQVANTRPVG